MKKRTKNIYLALGFVVVLIMAYRIAISKTLDVKREYQTLKQEEVIYKNTPKQLLVLKQKEVYYDSLLTKYQLKGSSIQNNLLKTINANADSMNVKVVEFLEPHSLLQNDLKVNTYQFTLEGDYNAILKLVYHLEQHTRYGEIIHLNFEKKKNYRTNTYYLQAKVLLKSFG